MGTTLLDWNQRDVFEKRTFALPPASLLHSSHVPSAEDQFRVENTIGEVQLALTSVDYEILRLRLALAELESYRDDLQTNLTHHQSVLSPIRRLPPEILEDVFLFATVDSRISWPRLPRDADDMPWCLGKVCSFWRTIFISLPKLWSRFHLDIKSTATAEEFHDSHPRSDAVQEFLQACLIRSGNELLTLSVKAQGSEGGAILSTLVAHSERWREVSFEIGRFFQYCSIFALAKNRVHNLQYLHIGTFLAPDSLHIDAGTLDAFEDCPNLKELSLSRITNPFYVLHLPWAQITHFISKSSTFRQGEFTRILGRMTDLVSFSSEGERILEVTSAQPVQLLLPKLQNLAIANKGSYITKTFQCLTTPSLTTLSIDAVTIFVPEQAISMLARSGCRLTHLTLCSSSDMDAHWEENIGILRLLSHLPSLTYLRLSVLRSADRIIPRLAYHPLVAPLIPNLETFVLEDRFCTSAAEVADMLASRIRNPRPEYLSGLRSIKIQLSSPAPPKFPELEALKQLAEHNGVDIMVQLG